MDTNPFHPPLLPQLLRSSQACEPPNGHREPSAEPIMPWKIPNFFRSPSLHLQRIAAELLFNNICVRGTGTGNGAWGVKWRCVCGGGRTTSSLIMPWASLAAPQTWSLPPSALLSLSPSWTCLGRGIHSPRPSRGSPLLSLRLFSAPAAPCREPPPFLQRGGRRPAARAEVTWPPES